MCNKCVIKLISSFIVHCRQRCKRMEAGMPRIWFVGMQISNFSEDALCIQDYCVSTMLGL
jgi:hypothetical protein